MTFALSIVGVWNIFPAYLRTLQRNKQLRIIGVADGDYAWAVRPTPFLAPPRRPCVR